MTYENTMMTLSSFVFVSSVIGGLEDYRRAVADVIARLVIEGIPLAVLRVESEFAASSSSPSEVCYQGIDISEICVCILGPRYGSIHPETGTRGGMMNPPSNLCSAAK